MILNKRFFSCYSFGDPHSLRFIDGDGDDTPVLDIDLENIKSQKGEDGLNYFTDKHLEKLDLWGSDDPTKAKFKTKDGRLDVTRLTKSYLELEERLAKVSSPLPENATEAERFEHRKQIQKLGNVPATPEEYEILYPDNMPEDIVVDKEDEVAFKVLCHKHNISREGAQALSDIMLKAKIRDLENYTKAVGEQNNNTETMLKASMGPDDFIENGKLMQRFLRRFVEGDDERFGRVFQDIKTTLFRGGAETKVVIAKALAEAARMVEGSGSSIYTQHQEKMTEAEELKKEFPKSYHVLQD